MLSFSLSAWEQLIQQTMGKMHQGLQDLHALQSHTEMGKEGHVHTHTHTHTHPTDLRQAALAKLGAVQAMVQQDLIPTLVEIQKGVEILKERLL